MIEVLEGGTWHEREDDGGGKGSAGQSTATEDAKPICGLSEV